MITLSSRGQAGGIGVVAQLVERFVRNEKVAGSNPAGSTTCGMPPRVSADIPGNDVMSRRPPGMEYADGGPAGPSPATRMWCSGSTPASQAGDRGFEPRHPLHPENQNNGSDPLMGLAAVLSMWTLPEKTWTNSLGMGALRQGRKHATAPVAQRKSRCLLSTGSGYRNSVGARCLVHRHA